MRRLLALVLDAFETGGLSLFFPDLQPPSRGAKRMPLIRYLRDGTAAALDYDGTKRSIVRYLERYERDWGRPVWIRERELTMCAPPEEGGRWMIRSRVIRALRELTREGVLVRHYRHACYRLATPDDAYASASLSRRATSGREPRVAPGAGSILTSRPLPAPTLLQRTCQAWAIALGLRKAWHRWRYHRWLMRAIRNFEPEE